MTTRIDRLLVSGTIALALFLASPARGGDTEPGVWWEQTIQMEMPGLPMKMPAMKQKVCVSKNGMSEPPQDSKDQSCKVTDQKQDGQKMTWKTECKDGTTGEGEIVQGKDKYDGTLIQHSKQGDMTAKISAKLVGGDCDAAATRKQVAAIKKQQADTKKQMDESQEQSCEKYAQDVELRLFSGPMAPCKKPDQLAQACARISTREGYYVFKDKASDPEVLRIAKESCKRDPEKIRGDLCQKAASEVKSSNVAAKKSRGTVNPSDPLDFMAANCPDETQVYAKEVCAGRSFTGMPDNIRPICVKYAREEMKKKPKVEEVSEDSSSEEPKKAPKEQAADKAKNVLKGLFGK
jgi:hypothetical protein